MIHFPSHTFFDTYIIRHVRAKIFDNGDNRQKQSK